MKKLILKSLVAGLVTVSASNAMAACVYVDWRLPSFLQGQFASADLKMDNNIRTNFAYMDSEINKASQESVDKITAAVFVLSNQKAVGTSQINTALKDNTQVQASAMQAINQSKRYQQVLKDYGAQGQGYDACGVSIKRESIADATKATQEAIEGMVNTEITARAGKYGDSKKAMATRLALHKKYYCTEGQAKAGLCQAVGERGGNSLSASTMFVESDYLSAEYNDKSALINNMVGLPDDPVPESQVTTATGQSYSDMKRRKDAIKSTAMTSLKAIQAEWSAVPSAESHSEPPPSAVAGVKTEKEQLAKEAPKTEGVVAPAPQKGTTPIGDMGGVKAKAATAPVTGETNPAGTPPAGTPVTPPTDTPAATPEEKRAQSLMAQVKADVARYLGGGQEYEEWSKVLVGQEEKGLLTEVLKVKALRLYLQTQEFKQLQRMEAMFAANVAATTENSGMSGRVEAQRQVAVRHAIRDNIVVR